MPDIEFSDRPKCVSLVKPARGEMSEMLLPLTHSAVRLVKPAKAEISEITLLAANPKCVNLVKPATGEMSDTELFQKSRYVRLVACSNPVRLRTPASGASRRVKVPSLTELSDHHPLCGERSQPQRGDWCRGGLSQPPPRR